MRRDSQPPVSRSESYDTGNLAHETLLLELWTLLLPDRPLLKRVTKQWQDIGERDGGKLVLVGCFQASIHLLARMGC